MLFWTQSEQIREFNVLSAFCVVPFLIEERKQITWRPLQFDVGKVKNAPTEGSLGVFCPSNISAIRSWSAAAIFCSTCLVRRAILSLNISKAMLLCLKCSLNSMLCTVEKGCKQLMIKDNRPYTLHTFCVYSRNKKAVWVWNIAFCLAEASCCWCWWSQVLNQIDETGSVLAAINSIIADPGVSCNRWFFRKVDQHPC